jgi:hypothetical protein
VNAIPSSLPEEDGIDYLTVQFVGSTHLLVTRFPDYRTEFFDATTGEFLTTGGMTLSSLALHPDQTIVAGVANDQGGGEVLFGALESAATSPSIRWYPLRIGFPFPIGGVSFDVTGRTFAACGGMNAKAVDVRKFPSGACLLRNLESPRSPAASWLIPWDSLFLPDEQFPDRPALAPSGRRVLYPAMCGNLLESVRRTRGTETKSHPASDSVIVTFDLAPTGGFVATGALDGTIILWESARFTQPQPKASTLSAQARLDRLYHRLIQENHDEDQLNDYHLGHDMSEWEVT